MTVTRPAKLIDPVCGMSVDVETAEAAGLLVERDGRIYGFCRPGCRAAFVDEPEAYVAQAEVAADAAAAQTEQSLPVIDEGMRRWYESCSCCLSDAYPEIKAQFDAERAAHSQAPPEPGICEVAEAATPA